jgi:hypothetical protein
MSETEFVRRLSSSGNGDGWGSRAIVVIASLRGPGAGRPDLQADGVCAAGGAFAALGAGGSMGEGSMRPFVINGHDRLVFPSNFTADLDFSVLETLEQLAAVIRRDSRTRTPTGTEILQRVDSDAYRSRYEPAS